MGPQLVWLRNPAPPLEGNWCKISSFHGMKLAVPDLFTEVILDLLRSAFQGPHPQENEAIPTTLWKTNITIVLLGKSTMPWPDFVNLP